MEINDLKAIWKRANDQQVQGYWVSQEDVRTMIKKKSKATIADAKRQLWQKVRMSTIVFFVGLIVGILNLWPIEGAEEFVFDSAMTRYQYGGMMLFMSIVIAFISIHARIRYRQIIRLEQGSGSLKSMLEETKQIIGKIMKTGERSDAIVTPLIMVFALGTALYKEGGFVLDERLFYMIGFGVLCAVGFSYLGKYLMKRRFGRFITALVARLEELEATNSENNAEKV